MILGVVRLAPGRAAFYDDLTNIHLMPSKPEANVYAGMNTANLKKGVQYGTIRLVAGTLDVIKTEPANNFVKPPVAEQAPDKKEEEVKDTVLKTAVKEAEKTEEVKEAPAEPKQKTKKEKKN